MSEEENEVTAAIEYHPTVIVFGQNAYAKSRIVNELFNNKLFPPLENNSDMKLRMVRILHGKTNTVRLTMPDDYDLMENLEAYNGPWKTIPLADLELSDDSKNDGANGLAVLEVTQDHPMLRYCRSQVIVSPSRQSTDQFEDILKQCTDNSTPIYIYAFANNFLSEEVSIFFIFQIFFFAYTNLTLKSE